MKRNNNINLKRVPPKFKSIIRKMVKIILAESKDTRAIVLIGSVADNTYKKSSDIDLVWAKSHKIGYKRQGKMEERLNP
jgi:predicted nucleotidyltransferase